MVPNQHPGRLSDGRASSFKVFKSFSMGLSAEGCRLFIRLRNYFQSSKSAVLSVYKVSEPSCRELSAWVKPLYKSKGLSAGSPACFTCSEHKFS